MSHPVRRIYCDRCDWKMLDSSLYGGFQYVLPDGAGLSVKSTIGWCYECNRLCPVEDLSVNRVIDDIGHLLDAIRSWEEALVPLQKHQDQMKNKRAATLLGRLLGSDSVKLPADEAQIMRNYLGNIEGLRNDIVKEASRFRFLRTRNSPAKCLVCSSANIEIASAAKSATRTPSAAPLGLVHPGCGGELSLQDKDDLRIGESWMECTYDMDGVLLEATERLPYGLDRLQSKRGGKK